MIKKLRNVVFNNQHRCVENWNINYDEVKRKINEGALLVDVRSIQEYNEGHLENAINFSYYDIPAKHNKVLPDKGRTIVVYCQNGGRSKRAYKKLKKLGYENVYNLCGGLENI